MLPAWAQFPLGGENSLLGLHVAERLGNSRSALLAELRYDLISRWLSDAYLSGAYTVGAVSAQSDPLPPVAQYVHGVGLAFSLATLLGPMRVSASQRLDVRLAHRTTLWYVNLGHEF